jgi:hypothetical protein
MKTYCKYCSKITSHREKGARERVLVCNKCDATNMPVTLIKSNGETHHGTQFKFVEWGSEELGSRAKQLHDEPQLEYSVIIDPQYASQYTWLTTPITEIESDTTTGTGRCIAFKTKNSNYTLHITKTNGKA